MRHILKIMLLFTLLVLPPEGATATFLSGQLQQLHLNSKNIHSYTFLFLIQKKRHYTEESVFNFSLSNNKCHTSAKNQMLNISTHSTLWKNLLQPTEKTPAINDCRWRSNNTRSSGVITRQPITHREVTVQQKEQTKTFPVWWFLLIYMFFCWMKTAVLFNGMHYGPWMTNIQQIVMHMQSGFSLF